MHQNNKLRFKLTDLARNSLLLFLRRPTSSTFANWIVRDQYYIEDITATLDSDANLHHFCAQRDLRDLCWGVHMQNSTASTQRKTYTYLWRCSVTDFLSLSFVYVSRASLRWLISVCNSIRFLSSFLLFPRFLFIFSNFSSFSCNSLKFSPNLVLKTWSWSAK